jgi:hypothetical protein
MKTRRHKKEYGGIKCKQHPTDHPDFGRHNKSAHDAKQPTYKQHLKGKYGEAYQPIEPATCQTDVRTAQRT